MLQYLLVVGLRFFALKNLTQPTKLNYMKNNPRKNSLGLSEQLWRRAFTLAIAEPNQ